MNIPHRAEATRRRWHALPLALLLAALGALGACTAGRPPASSEADAAVYVAPEGASLRQARDGVHFSHQAVAAANPLAAQAGLDMLRAGGSAVDAAIAVQLVLGLVEPQSSGLGGGAFLMVWDGQALHAWDGRETAPAAADEGQFLRADGQPMTMAQAVPGGLSVGVPGVLRMLEAAHRQHGKLAWSRLFEPALALAQQGFLLSPRLHDVLVQTPALARQAGLAVLYFEPVAGGAWRPRAVGSRIHNPAYAAVLRQIAAQGSDAFYTGAVARDIVARVQTDARQAGRLSLADLAAYQPRQRAALCTDMLRWRVCGMPPPSSGHLTMMQIVGLLQGADGQGLAEGELPTQPDRPQALQRYLEASRLAFADRARYVGDPDFVAAPAGRWDSLLDRDYLAARSRLMGERSQGEAPPGRPTGAAMAWAPQPDQPEHGTSHISIADRDGRVLAMTTTIEAGFGAQILSDGGTGLPGGFLLNNELTDFSFSPRDAQGRPVANRVEPGKRPRSSMSPTLVFDRASGRVLMSLGSPGGAAIIHFTAKTLLAMTVGGLAPQAAIDLPNLSNFNGPAALLEAGQFPLATVQALQARGNTVLQTPLTSGLQALQRDPAAGGWRGGADPRREGVVLGD
jgi:gamma-glutamyltranspeptidase / glutathione hydrolase